MKTHLILALASLGLMAPLAFAGCTAPVDSEGVDEETAAAAGEIKVTYDYRFYSVRKNTDCKIRLCTGYFVKEVNSRYAERHVDSLKFLDPEVEKLAVIDRDIPDGGLILRGFIGLPVGPWEKKALVVSEAYRGMPGEGAKYGDGFYRVRHVEQPFAFAAYEMNTSNIDKLVRADVTSVVHPYVEHGWLRDRVLHHGAIVAGHMHEKIGALDINQVYLRLPDERAECKPIRNECGPAELPAYTRDAERCLVFDKCMPANGCGLPKPGWEPRNRCAEGYTQVGWAADVNGCVDRACEPDFIAR